LGGESGRRQTPPVGRVVWAPSEPALDSPGRPRQQFIELRPDYGEECLGDFLSRIQFPIGQHRDELRRIPGAVPGGLQHEHPAGLQDPVNLLKRSSQLGDMFQRVKAEDALHTRIGQGEAEGIAAEPGERLEASREARFQRILQADVHRHRLGEESGSAADLQTGAFQAPLPGECGHETPFVPQIG
jgi:hypothetical protein